MTDLDNILDEHFNTILLFIGMVGLFFYIACVSPPSEFDAATHIFTNERLDKNIVWNKSIFPNLFIIERSAEIFCEIKGYDFVNKFTIGLNGDFSCTKGFTGKEKTFLNGTRYTEMSYVSHSFPVKCLETIYLKDVECKSKLEGEI